MRLAGSPFTKSVLCVLALFTIAQAQTRTYMENPNSPKGNATIRGKVVYDDNDKPIRRVRVMLVFPGENLRVIQMSGTDGNGEFTFKNVVEGNYRVVVDFGTRTANFPRLDKESGTPVTVAAASMDLKIRSPRVASISGKVTYPDGEPVIGAQVNVLLKSGKQWVHPPLVANAAETDDRGTYRLYPLRAGEYVVTVNEQGFRSQEGDRSTLVTAVNESLNPYYYQDAASLKTATIVPVEAGRETSNINFVLNERATYTVSGRITVADKPLPNVNLELTPRDDGSGGNPMNEGEGELTRADKDGNWAFKRVPDGNYYVVVSPNRLEATFKDVHKYIFNNTQVTVGGADVPGVVLNLTEAGQISGTVTVEGGKPLPQYVNFDSALVGSSSLGNFSTSTSGNVKENGTFVVEGVAPGENMFSLSTNEDYFVKSITWNNRDLSKQTIKVEGGKETKGVVVVLSTAVGYLTGRVLSADGKKPLPGIFFVLIPVDSTNWEGRPRWKSDLTDEAGDFDVSGAPGEYLFLSFPKGVTGLKSMEDLKALLPGATRVSLKATPQDEVDIIAPPN